MEELNKCKRAHCKCMQMTPCNNHHYSDCGWVFDKPVVKTTEEENPLPEWIEEFESKFCHWDNDILWCTNPNPEKLEDFIRSQLEKLLDKIKLEEKGFGESGQIKMLSGCNPDDLLEVVFCANNTISDTYNKAIEDLEALKSELRKTL